MSDFKAGFLTWRALQSLRAIERALGRALEATTREGMTEADCLLARNNLMDAGEMLEWVSDDIDAAADDAFKWANCCKSAEDARNRVFFLPA